METKKLNMPNTEFTQRSNSEKTEPQLLKLWEKTLTERNLVNTEGEFTLHDGPPYANGDVHMGHTLNKVLKDMVCKFNLMSGKKVNFRPGWDCHGLPTELGVQKKMGNLNTLNLRSECEKWANSFSEKQMDSFKSMGVMAEWDNPYKTMDKEFETGELQVLYKLLKNGLMYQQKRPVYYSPSSRTVLAESELEYKERKSKSAYFTLVLDSGENLLVWTTQPWTVMGNRCVCVNPSLEYSKVVLGDKSYFVLSTLKESLLSSGVTTLTLLGKELEGLKYKNHLTGLDGVVVCDSFVKDDSGTGLVHLCPAHGEEDFNVCERYGLYGEDLTDNAGNVDGLFCLDDFNEKVLGCLNDNDMLFKSEEYTHSYPHDWRTGKPVYFKLTNQFFLDLKDLKSDCLNELEKVEFSDQKWKNRLKNMLKSRDRWCLSRQRKWGFPLAVFLKNGEVFLNNELEQHLLTEFKLHGSKVWFEKDCNELLPEKFRNQGLTKCEHTLDVWFDSGSSWFSVLDGKTADVYFEGSDQHRGWFQSSLVLSMAVNGKSPYKKLYTHGFVLDENGKKMAKSLGNVVDPKEVQKKYNTDVLRLWCSVVNYEDDVSMGNTVLKNCADYYFKFRNTLKYLLGNMYGLDLDFKPELSNKDLEALYDCQTMVSNCKSFYESYDFRKVFEELMKWVTKLSSQYLDVETKSYLYEFELNSKERMTCQFVMKQCLESFMIVLSPMCSFLAEDAYQNYEFRKNSSVFMEKL